MSELFLKLWFQSCPNASLDWRKVRVQCKAGVPKIFHIKVPQIALAFGFDKPTGECNKIRKET